MIFSLSLLKRKTALAWLEKKELPERNLHLLAQSEIVINILTFPV